MTKIIKSLRGMNDVLPNECVFYDYVYSNIKEIFENYCIEEIKTPILEETSLFARGVGDATDIVEKEMFSFENKDGEMVTLRPEGTAGCIRAAIEHGMIYNQEQRLFYLNQNFRYERPQKGRYRQFFQIGVEILGIKPPIIDIEIIAMLHQIWNKLKVSNSIRLHINNIGSKENRHNFGRDLVKYLNNHINDLDEDSKRRLKSNPIRILDSKDEKTKSILVNAPKLSNYIDQNSKENFEQICKGLDSLGVKYIFDESLVRGLDYYNDTIFEWITDSLGSQGTVCGGGRYDGLVETLGGTPTSGFGFAIGLERLVLLIKEINPEIELKLNKKLDVYLINDEKSLYKSLEIAHQLRIDNIKVINSTNFNNVKKGLSKANKLNAKFVIILQTIEIEKQIALVKNMTNGEQSEISLNNLINFIKQNLKEI